MIAGKPKEARTPRCLPLSLQKQGRNLLHPQCWLWGHDTRRAEGNLLLQHGFERVRPPKSVTGCSQYTLQLEADMQVRLWGFGMFLGRCTGKDAEGLYVNRFLFTPWSVTLTRDVWEGKHFKRLPRCSDWPLLARALGWIVEYETALEREVGPQYRAQCLWGWENKDITARDLQAGWTDLRQRVQHLHVTA